MMADGRLEEMRDAHGLVGQVETWFRRKLSYNQKSELIFSSVEPDLVSESAGFRGPGHHIQLSVVVCDRISMILVP